MKEQMMSAEKKPAKKRTARSPEQDATARREFEKKLGELDEELKVWTETINESERLSEDDFAIRINFKI